MSGPLATVRGARPQAADYNESAAPLRAVWISVRANIRAILEHVTLADLAADKMPTAVKKIIQDPANWQ